MGTKEALVLFLSDFDQQVAEMMSNQANTPHTSLSAQHVVGNNPHK